ncbi:hypothetical protein [Clostridium botulinum]|uniref:hypothetical protein n=1 Tax=Clostridium botulinum TaxID=1491 RepID=UPI0004D3C665|nr:hypothetical protein [Clostridium botulinum]KEH90516.1 putative conjugative transposon protein [Clostridium botulinum C/D str. It1]
MAKITVEELLFNDEPITINRKLAKCLGLKEAVIFQQIHYWLKINEKKNQNFKNGKFWTYNSIKKWHEEEFDFLSIRTVERTLQKLEKDGLLISNVFNKMKGDKTKWYTINYDKLLEVCEKNLIKKQSISSKRSIAGKKGALAKKDKSENTMQPNWQNGGAYNQIGNTMQPNWQNDNAKLAEPIPETTTKTTTKITSSSSLVQIFNDNICELRKTTSAKFIDYTEKYNYYFILTVIEYCSEINIKSFAGFKKVIDAYIEKNILTKEEFIKDIEEYRATKNKTKKSYIKKSYSNKNKIDSFNNYNQRNYDFEELEKLMLGESNKSLSECIKGNEANEEDVSSPVLDELKKLDLA